MKKTLLTLVSLIFISSAAFAESPLESCQAEAKDSGIEDTTEFNDFVNNCVEQITEAEKAVSSETAESIQTEQDMATTAN
ncbi:MAG: hypothetical protein OEX19_01580 [Gammaproteobacteria bacterium]|nr:hypothetical protein [Gammaproteobacteria bacterium]